MNEGEAHWVSSWLVIATVDGRYEVGLMLDLLVEIFLAIAESGSLFETVPFLGALAVSVAPPLGIGASLSMADALDLHGSGDTIWMPRWLVINSIITWNKVTLKFDFIVEFILAIAESCSLFKAVPLLRALSITLRPPLSLFLVKIIQFNAN